MKAASNSEKTFTSGLSFSFNGTWLTAGFIFYVTKPPKWWKEKKWDPSSKGNTEITLFFLVSKYNRPKVSIKSMSTSALRPSTRSSSSGCGIHDSEKATQANSPPVQQNLFKANEPLCKIMGNRQKKKTKKKHVCLRWVAKLSKVNPTLSSRINCFLQFMIHTKNQLKRYDLLFKGDK